MKAEFKKYRIIAFTLLIVLGINVVMPAAVLAAGFYCDVQSNSPANTSNTAADCCTEIEVSGITGLSDDQDNVDYCTFERACNQSISDPLAEFQSILPVEKTVLPASAFFDTLLDNGMFSHISLDASLSYPTPPIFLLNSTFLN